MQQGSVAAPLRVELATEPVQPVKGHNPMEVRWGINPVVRDKIVEGHRAGFMFLPYGRFFSVASFPVPIELHSTDDNPNFPRETIVTKSAQQVEDYLCEMLGGYDELGERQPHKADWGVRFAFHGVKDAAVIEVISATLLPSLPSIRQIAASFNLPSPIDARCPGEEATDFGERQTCPTCWRQWITSAACDAYIDWTVKNPREVEIYDRTTQQTQVRKITPTREQLLEGRAIVQESLSAGVAQLQRLWREISAELEQGLRKGTDVYQDGVRRDVHADKPADAQLAQVREYARAVQGGGTAGGNDALIQALAAGQQQIQQILAAVLQQGGVVPAGEPIAPAVEVATTVAEDEGDLSPAAAEMKRKQQRR